MALNFREFEYLTFDCYGTLIDWETGILTALRPILSSHGIAPSDDEILEMYAEIESASELGPYRRYRETLEGVVTAFGEKLAFTPSASERAVLPNSVARWPAFADTVRALAALSSHYQLAILSNVDDDLFQASAALLETRFAHVITAQQVGSYKPSHRNFEAMLGRLAVPKNKILHVAQSCYHDIVPAHALGLSTVWVNRRAGKEGSGATKPAAPVADLEVPSLAALAAITTEAWSSN